MRSEYDTSLLDDIDEWLTLRSAILYVKMAYGLVLDAHSIWALGGKFCFLKKHADDFLINSKELDRAVARCYFPTIPKGYYTISVLMQKYKLPYSVFQRWMTNKRLSPRRIEIGLEEMIFLDEKDVKRLYKERQANENCKRFDRADFRWSRTRRGRGSKSGEIQPRKKKEFSYAKYKRQLERMLDNAKVDLDTERERFD